MAETSVTLAPQKNTLLRDLRVPKWISDHVVPALKQLVDSNIASKVQLGVFEYRENVTSISYWVHLKQPFGSKEDLDAIVGEHMPRGRDVRLSDAMPLNAVVRYGVNNSCEFSVHYFQPTQE